MTHKYSSKLKKEPGELRGKNPKHIEDETLQDWTPGFTKANLSQSNMNTEKCKNNFQWVV